MSHFIKEYEKLAQSVIEQYPDHHIMIFGRPGAGKGTLAESLSELGFHSIGMGRLIRKHVSALTTLSERVVDELADHWIVPDALASDMVIPELEAILQKEKSFFVLEGYPVTPQQYGDCVKFVQSKNLKLSVIWLDIPKSLAFLRLLSRQTCFDCHRSFPPVETTCHVCQTPLTVRFDDCREAIFERMNLYEKFTSPLVKKIKKDFPICHVQWIAEGEEEKFQQL